MRKNRVSGIVPVAALMVALFVAAPAFSDDGDPLKGKKSFRQCGVCHSLKMGKTKVGPSLAGLFGRKAASINGYKYSSALREAGDEGLVWDEEQVFSYLKNPTAFLKRYLGKDKISNKMKNKFKKEQFRRDIIAYLRQAAQ